jgi:hypothetical protein
VPVREHVPRHKVVIGKAKESPLKVRGKTIKNVRTLEKCYYGIVFEAMFHQEMPVCHFIGARIIQNLVTGSPAVISGKSPKIGLPLFGWQRIPCQPLHNLMDLGLVIHRNSLLPWSRPAAAF